MIDMRYLNWYPVITYIRIHVGQVQVKCGITIYGLDRNEPILSETDIDCDNIKAIKIQSLTKLIMGHHIVACEEFYVHNNVVIYLERRKTVPEELLHPAYMYSSCNQISYCTDFRYITRRHKKLV